MKLTNLNSGLNRNPLDASLAFQDITIKLQSLLVLWPLPNTSFMMLEFLLSSYFCIIPADHMKITRLSSKGQVIIPKALREAQHWAIGQELIAVDVGEGILLKSRSIFEKTTLDQVAGALKYSGKPKSLEDLENAIRLGAMEQWHDCR
jgi:bifunctional DNA-binding transcriptional regulator/antitoxin component of YhaV-PrlF toxin-antitoxin module